MTKLPPEEEDEVVRCRRMREEFDKRFKTLDEMFDYCARLRKRRGASSAKARASEKGRTTASDIGLGPRKVLH